jgi:hypothetical protein
MLTSRRGVLLGCARFKRALRWALNQNAFKFNSYCVALDGGVSSPGTCVVIRRLRAVSRLLYPPLHTRAVPCVASSLRFVLYDVGCIYVRVPKA